MILVELTRDMIPQRAGASILLPPEVARRLIAEGAAKNPRDRFGGPLPADPAPAPPAKRAYVTKRG